jgi:hypothetical protein
LHRQQHQHRAQVAHQGQQQAAQPFGAALALALVVQRADLFGCRQAFEQRRGGGAVLGIKWRLRSPGM